MKIALDSSPLISGHAVRGIGSYTQNLLDHLKNLEDNFQIENLTKNTIKTADIVHYPYFDIYFHTLPLRRYTKRIVTIHDIIPLVFPSQFKSGLRGKINLFLQKVALRNTDYVICDSESSKKDIAKILNYDESRIKVIYLAPDEAMKKTSVFSQLKVKKKFSLPDDFVLYVGDVNWNKNIPTLLEAVKLSNVNLVLVGAAFEKQEIPEVQAINNLIGKLNINSQVFKTGFVTKEELAAIYTTAKTTVMPSHYEGFGLPVLESMACGTPVICSDNSSLSEIAGEHAIFCDPQSAQDIADKIVTVCELDQIHKNPLSTKLISHAAKYTWQKTAKETIEVYKKVLRYS